MQKSQFFYDLPKELIAKYPTPERTGSRLLHLAPKTDSISHHLFLDLPSFLREGDLLIFNETKVIPGRHFGTKATGGNVEILLERLLEDDRALVQIRASKSPKPGTHIHLQSSNTTLIVEHKINDLYCVVSPEIPWLTLFETCGEIPLPPYMEREASEFDTVRYQTVYAKTPGAVAAPTAGLHFDDAMLLELEKKGISIGKLLLHVGAGTFQPVRTENIADHHMHQEYFEVSETLCQQIRQTRSCHGRVIAVGTTVVRALESLGRMGELKPYSGETDIFITPGFRFSVCDALITNFHLPESTLLMLVSAFAGYEITMKAYDEAVKELYRFFSYGDAMFIERNQ